MTMKRRIRLGLLAAGVLCLIVAVSLVAHSGEVDVPTKFERHYQAWREHCRSIPFASDGDPYLDSDDHKALAELGPAAIPLIVEKSQQDPDFTWLYALWAETSGFISHPARNPWAGERIVDWWEGGQQQTNERVDMLIAQGKGEAVVCLGIAALPRLMERIEAGEDSLAAVAEQITRGKAEFAGQTPEQKAASCLAWWEANKQDWLIPFPDQKAAQ